MTRELIIGVLLAGIVGIVWIVVYAALASNRSGQRSEGHR